jgi:hypothetical protein
MSVRLVSDNGPAQLAHTRPSGLFVLAIRREGAHDGTLEFRDGAGRTILTVRLPGSCFDQNYRDMHTCSGGGDQSSIPGPWTAAGSLDFRAARTLAARVLAHMHATGILKIEFAQPPELWTGAHGGWMYVTVATRRGETGEYQSWEAGLLAGAVHARAHAWHIGTLAGYSTLTARSRGCGVTPRAYTCDTIGSRIQGERVPSLHINPAAWITSKAQLRARLSRRIHELNLHLVSMRFISTGRTPIPVVVVRTPTPRVDWTHANLAWRIFGDSPHYEEGEFLEVLDRVGRPVYATGGSYISGGSAWTAYGRFGN